MKTLAIIEGSAVAVEADGRVHYVAKMAIDNDGSDNRQHDPDWQGETSLRHAGRSIDSERVPGIVVPPAIVRGVAGVVLGCRARVTYNGISAEAVVFDIGPRTKLGEGTPELARRLGIDPSALHGGVEGRVVSYELWPGVPAVVDGVSYELQPW